MCEFSSTLKIAQKSRIFQEWHANRNHTDPRVNQVHLKSHQCSCFRNSNTQSARKAKKKYITTKSRYKIKNNILKNINDLNPLPGDSNSRNYSNKSPYLKSVKSIEKLRGSTQFKNVRNDPIRMNFWISF